MSVLKTLFWQILLKRTIF